MISSKGTIKTTHCIIINLESDSNGLESHLFRGMNKAKIRDFLFEETKMSKFELIPLKYKKFDSSLKTPNSSARKTIIKIANEKQIHQVNVFFIMDNDVNEIEKSLISKNNIFDYYKKTIVDFLPKKNLEKFSFKFIMLPKNYSIEYLLFCLLNTDQEKNFSKLQDYVIAVSKIFKVKDNEKTVKDCKKIILNLGESILAKINEKVFSKNIEENNLKNIIQLLKTNIFRDKRYLIYRDEIKKEYNNFDTYHYLFDWFKN